MTIRDLRKDKANSADYDVCVVGSGPAGLAITKVLSDNNFHVCLLESGGLKFEQPVQSLNHGTQQGFRDDLGTARPRQFGGASSVWRGHCAPMDPDDFLPERWSGSIGWPLDYSDLAGYYRRAADFLDFDYRLLESNTYQNNDFLAFDGGRVQTKLFIQRPTRLGQELKDWIKQVDSVDLWVHASLSSVKSKGKKVEYIIARDLADKELKVKARIFVVAAGGLENPRLLLSFANSNLIPIDQNARKAIGRYFSLHPHFFYGALLLTGQAAEKPLYLPQSVNQKTRRAGYFQLHPEVRQKHKLYKALFRHQNAAIPEKSRWYDEKRLALWGKKKRVMLDTMFIQSAMPMSIDNRIELGTERDKLGMPKIRATVSMDSETFDNYHRSLLQYITELGLNGYGRVKFGKGVFSDYKKGKRTVSGGHHFMCTTRMAASPNDGVVDKDSRVFGVSNLYIAGASTFSSPAAVNPTLTLIALAIRLGDHLTKRL